MTDLREREANAAADAARGAAPRGIRSSKRPGRAGRTAAVWGWGIAGIVVIALVWETYKLLAPADGVLIGDLRVLPRTTDLAMPHA
ncbi:MAG TPA: hypothetical protein VL916_04260, partial [Ilumatobacteraceae bacterium]|nr:hypothetical protein [Ilumatobacteraceae bacterium]